MGCRFTGLCSGNRLGSSSQHVSHHRQRLPRRAPAVCCRAGRGQEPPPGVRLAGAGWPARGVTGCSRPAPQAACGCSPPARPPATLLERQLSPRYAAPPCHHHALLGCLHPRPRPAMMARAPPTAAWHQCQSVRCRAWCSSTAQTARSSFLVGGRCARRSRFIFQGFGCPACPAVDLPRANSCSQDSWQEPLSTAVAAKLAPVLPFAICRRGAF